VITLLARAWSRHDFGTAQRFAPFVECLLAVADPQSPGIAVLLQDHPELGRRVAAFLDRHRGD
jgi:hypothetical protein